MRYALVLLVMAAVAGPAGANCLVCGFDTASLRAAEVARMEQTLYRRVDHTSRLRRLRAEIRYSEARIKSLRTRLDEYSRVNRFRTGNALTITQDRARLDLMREEVVLRDLREQVILENRAYRMARRLAAAPLPAPTHAPGCACGDVNAELTNSVVQPQITIINH